MASANSYKCNCLQDRAGKHCEGMKPNRGGIICQKAGSIMGFISVKWKNGNLPNRCKLVTLMPQNEGTNS